MSWLCLCDHGLLLPQGAEFVHAKLWDPETKRLRRSFRVGPSAAQGFADDYAYMIAGLLDLYQARVECR